MANNDTDNKKLPLELIDISDASYQKPERRNNFVAESKYKRIDNTCVSKINITNRGKIVVPKSAFPVLLNQTKKDANYIYDNQIPDGDKLEINNEQFANGSAVIGLLDSKAQETRDAGKADLLRYARDSIINIGDSDQAEAIRRQIDSYANAELPKLKKRRGVDYDEITHEPLTKNSAFHHDNKKSIFTDLDNLLDTNNGINVNQETHNAIHQLNINTKEEREQKTELIKKTIETNKNKK